MKKISFLIMISALGVNLSAQTPRTAETALSYLEKALTTVLRVSTMVPHADFEWKSEGALWGAYLEPKKSLSRLSHYEAGVEYLLLGGAHDPYANIDLKVYQGNTGGTVLREDTLKDPAPVIRFTPPSSGDYTFEIINASSLPVFAALVVLSYKENGHFNFDALSQARTTTLRLSNSLGMMIPLNSSIPQNSWALFGGDARVDSSTGYYNAAFLAGRRYILIGAGASSVIDCDVEIIEQNALDDPGGKRISPNSGTRGPADYEWFNPDGSRYYKLDVYNKSSLGRANSFMLGFLIQEPR